MSGGTLYTSAERPGGQILGGTLYMYTTTPDLKFQGGPYFLKLSVRADQNFQRKFPSGTKFFRTKIPVTDHKDNELRKISTNKPQRYVRSNSIE